MKFSYRIFPEQRLAILRFRGSIALKDVVAGIQNFWADSAYDPAYNGIVSLEGVTTRVKIEELKELLVLLNDRKTSVGSWAAILTEPRTTALGLIFKAAFTGTMKLEIVSTWEAACAYLQVELPRETANC